MFQVEYRDMHAADLYQKWLKLMHVKAILPKPISKDTIGVNYLQALATGYSHPSELIR